MIEPFNLQYGIGIVADGKPIMKRSSVMLNAEVVGVMGTLNLIMEEEKMMSQEKNVMYSLAIMVGISVVNAMEKVKKKGLCMWKRNISRDHSVGFV